MIYISKGKESKIYAKVWKVDKKENYTALNISTSDKQQDGTYKNSSWNARLVGKAKDVQVNEGDRITITSAKIENIYNKEQKRSWLNIIVFDLEVDSSDGFRPLDDGEDDVLPF